MLQCAWLLARLQTSYPIMLTTYQGDLSRFVVDLSRFAQMALQESSDGSSLIPWELVSGPAVYLDCEPSDPQYAKTSEWVLGTRQWLMRADTPFVLFWVIGDIASPSVKDLLRVSPARAYLRTEDLDDPQHVPPQPQAQAARYNELLSVNVLLRRLREARQAAPLGRSSSGGGSLS